MTANYALNDPRELHLCLALDINGSGKVKPKDLKSAITSKGIHADDFRLKESMNQLAQFGENEDLTFEQLRTIIRPNIIFLEQILQGNLVVPDFADFANSLKHIFSDVAKNEDGRVSECIPQLALVDSNKWGMSLCTVDGQRLALGDSGEMFSIQSCCKPINYCLALEEHGEQEVHKFVGREPS
jgi:glutaminase